MAIEPMMPGPWLLSRLPPKNMPNCATIEIAPAMVAVIVISNVSWFLTCASSCAITPASSSRLSDCIRPVVTATAAFCGLRPVANALGCASSITNTRGIGRPARPASSATRWKRSGALLRSTSWAPYIDSTMRSEFQ